VTFLLVPEYVGSQVLGEAEMYGTPAWVTFTRTEDADPA
jgi:hypothetical protein